MTLTTHVAIGSLLATSVSNPALGFVLGIIFHLLADVIPHGDNNLNDGFKQKTKKKRALAYVTTDACLAIGVLLFVTVLHGDTTARENHIFAATIVGSILPDLIVGLEILYKNRILQALTRFHFLFHDSVSRRFGDVPLAFGLGYQAIFLVIALHSLALVH